MIVIITHNVSLRLGSEVVTLQCGVQTLIERQLSIPTRHQSERGFQRRCCCCC